jgi:tetraacyldisaccharide 4'-kinase
LPPLDAYFREVMLHARPGVVPGGLRAIAAMAEPVYRAVVSGRNGLYDSGKLRAIALPRAVVSVGNLSVGGTGKTPVVIALARLLLDAGEKPAVLLRGYRSSAGGSDEAVELARSLPPHTPVIPNADRVAGAQAALAARPDTSVFILDDGFQHRRVRRDFDLVLVSCTQGLCQEHVLPRGLLREPPGSLARASAILLTRTDQVPEPDLAALRARIAWFAPGVPQFECRHAPADVLASTGETLAPVALSGRRVLLVVGTGDPVAVADTARSLGCEVAGTRIYRDHHAYSPADVADITAHARSSGASAVLTTHKDFVKLLPSTPATLPTSLPLLALRIQIVFAAAEQSGLVDLIGRSLKEKRPHGGG